jgi:hypothetical protein
VPWNVIAAALALGAPAILIVFWLSVRAIFG